MKALELGGGAIASISAQGMAAEFITTAISGISLPGQIVSGMQWQYNLTMQGMIPMPTGEQVQSNGAYSAAMQEMGTETITVPAGTFEVIKFQSTSTVDFLVPFGDLQVPMKYTAPASSVRARYRLYQVCGKLGFWRHALHIRHRIAKLRDSVERHLQPSPSS